MLYSLSVTGSSNPFIRSAFQATDMFADGDSALLTADWPSLTWTAGRSCTAAMLLSSSRCGPCLAFEFLCNHWMRCQCIWPGFRQAWQFASRVGHKACTPQGRVGQQRSWRRRLPSPCSSLTLLLMVSEFYLYLYQEGLLATNKEGAALLQSW